MIDLTKWDKVPVPGFEDLYYVNRQGQIYSVQSEKILHPAPPHLQVILCNKQFRYTIRLAKLIYWTYSGHELVGDEHIGFLDGNVNNTSYDNLTIVDGRSGYGSQSWVTDNKRTTWATKMGWIMCYGPNGEVLRAGSHREASELTGISKTSVGDVLQGKRESVKGWTFERVKENDCAW